jgi:glycosyltransferase involved in cell wall biosynthesis
VLRNTLLATRFDIVILETLYLTPYIPDIRDLSEAKIVLRSHNIEHRIWKRYASNIRNPFKKLYLNILSKELEQYEKSHINDYDGILPITDVDRQFYEKHAARGLLMAHPFATNARIPENITAVKSKNSLFHLGSMDWIPNQEGILWFLNKVWPEVHTTYPQLSFSLAGRNMPAWIHKRQDAGLVVDGEIDNAYKYMQSKNIMIVPLFSGSGIRIKIVEGMLNKNVVITTAIGAEGIDCKDGEHILLANNAAEFKARIQWCMENPDQATELGERASTLIKEKYNLEESSKELDNYLQELSAQ